MFTKQSSITQGGTWRMSKEDKHSTNYLKSLRKEITSQLVSNNVEVDFPTHINTLEKTCLNLTPCKYRKDFRGERAFTIDCADCKDMDDAISVLKIKSGYRLGVHIADVATYVPIGSDLDRTASSRATSFYFPNMTIPMLPDILSNNLCSLNPGVDRNTLSVIMKIDENGKVYDSEITKGLIRSRVKGVYSEINSLFNGSKDSTLIDKYSDVRNDLIVMQDLYNILRSNRKKRGATVQDDNLPEIIVEKDRITISPKKEGLSENIIEEFMILANSVVSEYLYNNNLPAIFRVQEERNHLAAYQTKKEHHAELALENYSHFTSPIRRIADLKIHQIITLHLNIIDNDLIHKLFDYSLVDVCDRATKKSRTAKNIQDRVRNYCYEEYFRTRRNISYLGKVTAFNKYSEPVITIDNYNIKVVGHRVIEASIDDELSFNVDISNGRLIACNVQKRAA